MSYAWQNGQTNRQTDKRTYLQKLKILASNERAIGDCVLAKIFLYDAHCNGDSDNWNIVYYIDLWLLWKSKGLHVLADDANALYPSTPIRPVLWPGDLVIRPLTLKINRALYSAKMHLCMKFCEAMSKHSWGKKVTISFKHEYKRHTLTSRCDVISDVMNTFYVIMCDVLSISYVKMNLSQIFRNL